MERSRPAANWPVAMSASTTSGNSGIRTLTVTQTGNTAPRVSVGVQPGVVVLGAAPRDGRERCSPGTSDRQLPGATSRVSDSGAGGGTAGSAPSRAVRWAR
jgi:hypothetical protein